MRNQLRLTALLVTVSIPGIIMAVLMTPQLVKNLPVELPPMTVLMVVGALQTLVLVSLTALLGTVLAPRLGLGAPALEGWLAGRDVRSVLKEQARLGLSAGLLAGFGMVLAEVLVFRPYLPDALYLLANPIDLQYIVTALAYGGIVEEVLMRWGLMSLLAWLFSYVTGRKRLALAILLGNVVAAVVFGVAHFPAVLGVAGALTTPIIVRTVVLNALPGMLFGWLYYRRGLEAAMFAHMGAHLAMAVVRLIAV